MVSGAFTTVEGINVYRYFDRIMIRKCVLSIVKQISQKSPRKSLKATASLLGLAAGAVGWSGLAQAAGEEAGSQMMLLPEHYELMENGVVVFKLETGENLSLTADQYLILEDGLLLITDKLAQASIYGMPVMGSVRAQLLNDLEQVATIDGTVAEAAPSQTLAITEGTAPRLSEQVDLQSYEIAQAGDGSSSEVGEAVAVGLSVSPGAMALLGMLMTSDQPGETEEPEAPAPVTPPAPPAPPPAPEFLSNTMFQALTPSNARVFTGSAGDSYIGYGTPDNTSPSNLVDAGRGSGNSATFNMSAGGDNLLLTSHSAGAYSGALSYIGGSGSDELTFGINFAIFNGSATIDLGSDTAADKVTFVGAIGSLGGSVTIKNFNYNHDAIDVAATVSATAAEITDAGGNLTWTDSGSNHTITFEGIGTGGTGVQATTAQLIADII